MEAAADVEEADGSLTNTANPVPEPGTTAQCATAAPELASVFPVVVAREAGEVDCPSATAGTILPTYESSTFTAAAVAEVLVALIKVFVAGTEVFSAVVKIFVTAVAVATCLACKKRASTASSKGKARHLVMQKDRKVSTTRKREIRNMMGAQQV